MVCYNNYAPPAPESAKSCSIGGNSLSCIINLIIIVVVLQFLTQILCSSGCDLC